MRVFISVGTTRFDDLISIFGDVEVLREISKAGVTHLTIQHGNSPFKVPSLEVNLGLEINFFDYAPSLAPYLNEADIIFSHAATGIYLEAMQLQLPHFLVVNTSLHENHQAEFANLLIESTRCRTFANANAFRSYLLSGVLKNDFSLMKNSVIVDQLQTPPAFLDAISYTHKPSRKHRGTLGLISIIILILILANTS